MTAIFSLLEAGKVIGLVPETPEVISTGSSYIFLFRKNNIAYKLYRRDNEHWNTHFSDISSGEDRRSFIIDDYNWNHLYNPNVYFGLKQATVNKDNLLELSNDLSGDELVIEMQIIKDSSFLINVLHGADNLTKEDYFSIGQQIATATLSQKFKPFTSKNFYEIMKERIPDIVDWMENFSGIEKSFIRVVETYLSTYVENSKHVFEKLTDKDFVSVIDCHGANTIYEKGKISFVDVFLPKPLWRVGRVNENFFRIGADIIVLRGQEAYEAYRDGFTSITPFDNSHEVFDQVYNASIMFCAQMSYAEKDMRHQVIADTYYQFIKTELEKQ